MSRGVHSVIVGRDWNSKISFKVYVLSTSTVIHTDKFVELPAAQDFIAMMNALSQNELLFPWTNPLMSKSPR